MIMITSHDIGLQRCHEQQWSFVFCGDDDGGDGYDIDIVLQLRRRGGNEIAEGYGYHDAVIVRKAFMALVIVFVIFFVSVFVTVNRPKLVFLEYPCNSIIWVKGKNQGDSWCGF